MIYGQLIPDRKVPAAGNLIPILANQSIIAQGIDPGLVSTATGAAITANFLFYVINKFKTISDDKAEIHLQNVFCITFTGN
ncbi:hypothetical protein [Parasitella parasitica]|uniref:Uncharacterized protein n=1 Tax=Parasitella parasitica TaxID=35722 RepID=A0A0B7NPN5_9FUNG|nr:hypothetical protein [Parasitella parasitica]